VPKPRSKSSAPKDTKPSGTFIMPENIPDRAASIFPTSLLPSASGITLSSYITPGLVCLLGVCWIFNTVVSYFFVVWTFYIINKPSF
jgi:tellurite resistance protein TehA-like permease